ncbi:MAG: PhoH family protein, partial [Proteobacteria bacterium]|nr:PhoH family protein [Pseudomonadota bacterium]MBU1583948.1 PhoH family protein [Pseudomonadota bacterium]MBU2454272.1 PhoH family protein [Pseudomonadota bacterium]
MAVDKTIVVDTSTLVHDPLCMEYLIENKILACIPWTVLEELDHLKRRTDVGFDAREASRNIEKLRQNKSPYLKIIKEINWKGIEFLDHHNNDHMIIAAANAMRQTFSEVELISKDTMMRIKARELGFKAQDYYRNQAKNNISLELPRIEVKDTEIDKDHFIFAWTSEKHGTVGLNDAVVCISDWKADFKRVKETGAFKERFAAVRIGSHFQIIPNTIQAFGIQAYAGPHLADSSDSFNWPQNIALYHLSNPQVALVFLEGGAGTGKTLLALAAALEQRRAYRQILVSRPMVHLEDTDNIGYLPGNINEKMSPWLRPIWQNVTFLKEVSAENQQVIDKLLLDKKIDIEPLDYIRGTTFFKCLLIIDEAQNLTPHQVKTIITR